MSSKRRKTELAKLAQTHHVAAIATDESILDFLSGLNCPRSLAVWLLYHHGEHQQLVDLDIEPLHYDTPQRFRDAYAAYSFLSKADFFKLALSKKDAAFQKFFKYEELCKETNSRFRNLLLDPKYKGTNVALLHATSCKISKILGDFRLDEMFEEAGWGPGVSTLIKGEHVSAVNKFHAERGITRDLYALVGDWFSVSYPGWHGHLTRESGEQWCDFQIGNSIVTVPKNSKTDRVIAVEPGINLWFQKGIGSMIRRRLLRWGVDLNDQSVNQRLALEASRIPEWDAGALATVDFSSASDSIARELVRELIPHDWYEYMNACRSLLGKHDGGLIRWEKFSSMGNGFTFELESLIFFAAALAVREHVGASGTISVYGDDVILPVSCYDLFSQFSDFLGFKVNRDKSFSSSAFRESCGSHYFGGVDVKPIFLKERLRNVQSVYKLANSVRLFAHRCDSHRSCDGRFRGTWYHLYARVPKPLRFGIPLGIGDTGFIVNFDEATPALADCAKTPGFEGYYVSALTEIGVNRSFDGYALLLARLKVPSHQAYGNNYTLRGRTKLRVSRILVPRWYNLGSWSN